MTRKDSAQFNTVLFGLVAGQALFYFISGKHLINTDSWNVLVAIQFVVAFGAMIWSWRTHVNAKKNAEDTHE